MHKAIKIIVEIHDLTLSRQFIKIFYRCFNIYELENFYIVSSTSKEERSDEGIV